MNKELLPCPFTGENPAIIHRTYTDNMGSKVKCYSIASSACEVSCFQEESAFKIWNTRAQPKYKRVDLEQWKMSDQDDMLYYMEYNRAIDDIKSKYGDLYVEVK